MRALALSAAASFVVDQASKVAVIHWLDLKNVLVMPVAPPFLVFRMGWNTGINFGLLSGTGAKWLLVALAVIISAALVWWARGFARTLPQVSAGLVVGGALANALDRLLYGAVADFLNMSCCGIDNPFAFNLADVFIFAGAFGLILWGEDRDRAAKTP